LAADGQVSLAEGQFAKAQALEEQLLQAAPENESIAVELAQLLLDQREMENAKHWTVLKVEQMKSKGGATLAMQSDGSIVASAKVVPGDVYKVSGVADPDRIAAVRLEGLRDPSLPNKGPGRNQWGNSQLRAFRLALAPTDASGGPTPLPIESAWASFDF